MVQVLFGMSKGFQIFSKLSVPRWNNDRDCALGLRLTGKPNQGLRACGVDVAEFLDLLSLTRSHIRKLLCSAEYAHPTCTAGRGATFDWNRSFDPAWIDRSPVARAIVRGAPGKVLSFA